MINLFWRKKNQCACRWKTFFFNLFKGNWNEQIYFSTKQAISLLL